MPVLIDPPKPPPGILCDRRAARLLEVLKMCGGAPEGAIAVLAPARYRALLRVLRGAGFVRRCWKPGAEEAFWCPACCQPPASRDYEARCALGWLGCRVLEAGGRIERIEGVAAAFFPKTGVRLPMRAVPPAPPAAEAAVPGLAVVLPGGGELIPRGWYFARLGELKEGKLRLWKKT